MSLNHVDFLKTLSSLRTIPATATGQQGVPSELPPALGRSNPPVAPFEEQEAASEDLVAAVPAVYFSEVYQIWRPSFGCPRCIAERSADPESGGDDTCPHTQKAAYKKTMDRCLSGKGAIMLREHYNLSDGSRMVHIEWCETDPEFARKIEQRKKEAKKNSLVPTFGTGDN